MSTGFVYSPIHMTNRAVTSADGPNAGSPYVLLPGVTTLYEPSGLFLEFPPNPSDNDWVEIKHRDDTAGKDDPVTIQPSNYPAATEQVEMPSESGTNVMVSDQFKLSGRHIGYRWCYVTGIGWVIDLSHDKQAQKAADAPIYEDDFVRISDPGCTATSVDVNDGISPPVWRRVFGATCTIDLCRFVVVNNTIYQLLFQEPAPRITGTVEIETENVAPRLIFNGVNDGTGRLSLSDYDFLQLTPNVAAGAATLSIWRRAAGETQQASVSGFTFTSADKLTFELDYVGGTATGRVYEDGVLLATVGPVQLSHRGDIVGIAHQHLGGLGDESYWSFYRLAGLEAAPTRFATLITSVDTPYSAAPNEVVAADTDAAPAANITVQLESTLPDNSIVTVKKADQNINDNDVVVEPLGGRLIESPYFGVDRPSIALATPEAVATWIATPDRWGLISAVHTQYREYYRIDPANLPWLMPATPATIPIELDTALTPTSRLFSISGGVLTALADDLFLIFEIDIVFQHHITSNNTSGVEVEIRQQTTATISRTPRVAAFGTSPRQSAPYDSRHTRGLYALSTGQTVELIGEETYQASSNYSELSALFVTVTTFS